MLVSLDRLKSFLGITTTATDDQLAQWLAQASWGVRNEIQQDIGWVIQSVSVASPGVVTCYGHGLETGDTIVIAHSGTTPTLDGSRTVTRLTDDTFSVGVNVTASGVDGLGTFCKTYTEYYGGTGVRELLLRQRPIRSVSSVYEDGSAAYGDGTNAFAASTLLVAGTDYNIRRDNGQVGASGMLTRIGSYWRRPMQSTCGLLVSSAGDGNGNIKVTYTAGYTTIPANIQQAVCVLVGEIKRTAATGGAGLQSESFDFYSYSLASADPSGPALTTVKGLLKTYKKAWW